MPSPADHADFDRPSAVGHYRGDATVEEVNVLDVFVARLQLLAHGELDSIKVRLEQLQIGVR